MSKNAVFVNPYELRRAIAQVVNSDVITSDVIADYYSSHPRVASNDVKRRGTLTQLTRQMATRPAGGKTSLPCSPRPDDARFASTTSAWFRPAKTFPKTSNSPGQSTVVPGTIWAVILVGLWQRQASGTALGVDWIGARLGCGPLCGHARYRCVRERCSGWLLAGTMGTIL